MKQFPRILLVLLVGTLLLSACKINTPTPPVVPTPTETVAPTAVPTTPVEPGDLAPTPTVDTRLFDDDNKMICNVLEDGILGKMEEGIANPKIPTTIGEDEWTLGPKDALMTIIEYTDFQCPYCSAFSAELEKFMLENPDDVRLVFRHLPLNSIHPNATLASQASEAAGVQGKFWEMAKTLFEKQQDWSALASEDFTNWLVTEATNLKLDVSKFTTDLTSEPIAKKIKDATTNAESYGLGGTPTILFNGHLWQGNWYAQTMTAVLQLINYEKGLYTECPPWIIDQSKTYTATLETEKGDIKIELYPKAAPLTVNSFVFLSREGFFDGVTFHRVIRSFVAQTGDPSGTSASGPGYEFRNEITPELTYDQPGMVGMANSGPNSNGSQFFITYEANDSVKNLSGTYTIFGKVIEGMDVLAQLTERDPQTDPNAPAGDKIITITIEEK